MSSTDLTIVDVYQSAAAIGLELEKLIDAVGSDLVTDLMPRVIRVLEQLEACVTLREKESADVLMMQEELRLTKHEGTVLSDENTRLTLYLKQVESQSQNEIRNWMAMAKELEKENNRLKAQLSEKEGIVDREKANEQEAMHVLYQLKETVDGQREKLRSNGEELRTRTLEVDALQHHVDRLAKVTDNLRRRNELLNTWVKNSIQEKSELQSELRALEKGPVTTEEVLARSGPAPTDVDSPDVGKENIQPVKYIAAMNMDGKAIIDLTDPNRPRFTLTELQTVLKERDELKLDILELEDELKQYRPKKEELTLAEPEKQLRRLSSTNKVKGEPSGIKKLFGFLFRGKDKPAPSPQKDHTWEFIEKPTEVEGDETPIRAQRAASIASSSKISDELTPTTGGASHQRSRSQSSIQLRHKEPVKDKRQFVRTKSNKLVELGMDISLEINGNDVPRTTRSEQLPAVTVTMHPLTHSSSSLSDNDTTLEEIQLQDVHTAGGETTGSVEGPGSFQNPSLSLDSNGNQES